MDAKEKDETCSFWVSGSTRYISARVITITDFIVLLREKKHLGQRREERRREEKRREERSETHSSHSPSPSPSLP
jgi:hypothetical protein